MLRWLVKKIMKEEKEFENTLTNNRLDVLEYRVRVLQNDLMRLKQNKAEDNNDITIHLKTGERIGMNGTNKQLNKLYHDVSMGKSWIKVGNRGLIRHEDIRSIKPNEKSEKIVYADGMLMGIVKE